MYRKFLPALALGTLLSGCADVVTIEAEVKKPPQLDLGGIRKIKVEEFPLKAHEHRTSSAELILDSVVADLALDDPTAQKGEPLWKAQHSGLTKALTDNGYMQVSDGQDQDATLSGTIDYWLKDSVSESERHNYETNKDEEVYTLTRSADVTLNFTLTAAHGRVLAKSTVQASSVLSWQDTSEFSVRLAAGSDAKPSVLNALARANGKLVCMLAPCTVVVNHELRIGRSDDISKGNEAARHREWNTAVALWQKSLEPAPPRPEDRLAALHNLGVYFEIKGDLEQALNRYRQVYADSGKSDDKAEVDRVMQAIQDDARLQKLLQAKEAEPHTAGGKK